MRTLSLLVASAAGFALAASPLAAQTDRPQDPRVPPPVTWCDKPSTNPKWERQTVSLLLEISSEDSSEAHQRLKPYLPFLLSGIAERYVAERQPSRDINAAKTKNLPPGEPRYGPGDVGRMIFFDFLGNGTIDSIIAPDERNSILADDLKAALLAAIARGDIFGPYADSSVRTRLGLYAGSGDFEEVVAWPAFTLYSPVDRPAMAHPKNRPPPYPSAALRKWDGKLRFQYQVDENGRAVAESIKVIGADKFVWPSDGHRKAYEDFKRAVEGALPKMRFLPAEMNGCYITTWVQQEFVFEHGR